MIDDHIVAMGELNLKKLAFLELQRNNIDVFVHECIAYVACDHGGRGEFTEERQTELIFDHSRVFNEIKYSVSSKQGDTGFTNARGRKGKSSLLTCCWLKFVREELFLLLFISVAAPVLAMCSCSS